MSRETHRQIAATDTGVSRKIPEAAFAYYVAVLSYARMLKILKASGRKVSSEEEAFMDLVYAGNFTPPEPIAYYLKGFGNYKLQNQRELRFRASNRPIVQSADGSIGWFGRVDHNTHYLYASYPCLAVYVKRIQNDFNYTMDRNHFDPFWDLPDDMAPLGLGAGLPTSNLLGYAEAQILTPIQLQWYRNAGFNPDFEFDSEHDTIPFIGALMNAVQQEINSTGLKVSALTAEPEGSIAQSVVTQLPYVPEVARPESRCPLIARHALDINGSIIVAAQSLRYLQQHMVDNDEDRQRNTWSVYDYDNFEHVPAEWIGTSNHLYDRTSSLIKEICFRTVSYAAETEMRKLVGILMPNE